jgi:hypothetical protein
MVRSKEHELYEMEEKQSVLSGLLALYQAKLKNVSEIMRFYELTEKENEIKTTQLQRDVASLESLVASQKLTIESIERTTARSQASLQEAQQSRQQAQDSLALAQQRLAQAESRASGLDTVVQSHEELLSVKERAVADLEAKNARLRAEVATLNATVAQAAAAAVQARQQQLPVPPPPPTSAAAATVVATASYGKSLSSAASVSRETTTGQPLRRDSYMYDELFTAESQSSKILPPSAANSIVSNPNPAVAAPSAAPGRLIVPLPERSIVLDDSYGAMYGSVDSSTAHNISFGSSITAQTFAASVSRYHDDGEGEGAAQEQESVRTQGSFVLDTRGAGSAPVVARAQGAGPTAIRAGTINMQEAQQSVDVGRGGISAASVQKAAVAPPRTALDPTPMKRRVPRRLSEAINAVSASVPLEDSLMAAVTGSNHQSDTAHASAVLSPTVPQKPRVPKKTADPDNLLATSVPPPPTTLFLRPGPVLAASDSERRSPKLKIHRPAQQVIAVDNAPVAGKKKKAVGKSDAVARSGSGGRRGTVPPTAPKHRPAIAPEPESGRHHTFSAVGEGSTGGSRPGGVRERQLPAPAVTRTAAAPKETVQKQSTATSRKTVGGGGVVVGVGLGSEGRNLDSSVVYDDSLFGLIDDIELS